MKILINIVRNPSFEQHSACPQGPDNIRLSYSWNQIDTVSLLPLCSAEYCHACDNTLHFGVPYGIAYFQYPRSGNGMMQAEMYFDNGYSEPYKRDYVQGRFYKQLTAGKSYCITFYVVLEELSQYAINHIGAYIDNGGIDAGKDSVGCASPQISYTPQVFASTIITDTLKWVKVQGNFTATGNEKFITIGNFFDINNTDTIALSPSTANNFSWYLIDDVSVIESTAKADAGLAQVIEEGDSVHIGTNEEGMPCTWYVVGDTTPIGYSGGIWVKPDTTTTYVVEMDLCGNVTRDSVRVWVWPLGTPFDKLTMTEEVMLYPNPAGESVTVAGAKGADLVMYDVTGRQVYRTSISSNKQVINTEALQKGIYVVHVIDRVSGFRVTRKIVKE